MINSEAIWDDRDVATIALSLLDGNVKMATIDIWARAIAFAYFIPQEERDVINEAGTYHEEVCSIDELKQLWDEAGRKYGVMRIGPGGVPVICKPCKVISRQRTMKGVLRVKVQREEREAAAAKKAEKSEAPEQVPARQLSLVA